jgi:hypothetical protein
MTAIAASAPIGLRLTGLALMCLACGGCAQWNWRGPGFNDENSQVAGKLRPKTTPTGQSAGLDSRALEIERNLGVGR